MTKQRRQGGKPRSHRTTSNPADRRDGQGTPKDAHTSTSVQCNLGDQKIYQLVETFAHECDSISQNCRRLGNQKACVMVEVRFEPESDLDSWQMISPGVRKLEKGRFLGARDVKA